MALLKATRTVQYPLYADFTFNFNDTMADTAGVVKTFGSVYTDAGVFEVIPMPTGAVIIGGELIVETQGAGPTVYTVAVGNAASATAYLAATSVLTASGTRTALTPALLSVNTAGANVRITIASTVANASAGKFRVRIQYTIDGRANETVIV